MKKKVIALTIAGVVALSGVVSAASIWGTYKGNPIVRLTVDGRPILVNKNEVPAISYQNRTMIPINLLKNAGVNYTWDQKTKTVDIKSIKTTTSVQFNPAKRTKDIIYLGGDGVKLAYVAGSMSADVTFKSKTGDFNSDWNTLSEIFVKLIDFNTDFISVNYYPSDKDLNIITIDAKVFNNYINGTITDDELQKHWITTGSIFESPSAANGSGSALNGSNGSGTTITRSYPELYSNDLRTYLGRLTSNKFDPESVFNENGIYGSKYSTTSIWNKYGTYGSDYSIDSAFNKYSTSPPEIIYDNKIIGYVTSNTYITNGILPESLYTWLVENGF